MTRSPSTMALLSSLCLLATICCTGCQTASTGVTSPSATYLSEDVKYFSTGAKFKLDKEAAAMKAYNEQQISHQFSDDQTRPTVDMQKFAQQADNSVSVSAQ